MSGESRGMLRRPTDPTCVKWSKSCRQTQSCSDPSQVGLFSSRTQDGCLTPGWSWCRILAAATGLSFLTYGLNAAQEAGGRNKSPPPPQPPHPAFHKIPLDGIKSYGHISPQAKLSCTAVDYAISSYLFLLIKRGQRHYGEALGLSTPPSFHPHEGRRKTNSLGFGKHDALAVIYGVLIQQSLSQKPQQIITASSR